MVSGSRRDSVGSGSVERRRMSDQRRISVGLVSVSVGLASVSVGLADNPQQASPPTVACLELLFGRTAPGRPEGRLLLWFATLEQTKTTIGIYCHTYECARKGLEVHMRRPPCSGLF